MSSKKLGEFETIVQGSFDRSLMQKALNLHYIGQENCNKLDDTGKHLVSIDHPNMAALEKAHYRLCENLRIKIKGDLLEDGSIVNLRVFQ